MGYRVLSPSQEIRSKYQPRKGLEGPFFYPSGRVTYYDPKEEAYWDPTTDFYLSHEEASALKKSVFDAYQGLTSIQNSAIVTILKHTDGAHMSTINIKFGEYRNQPIINKQFKLVKGFQTGKKGSYVTVKNDGNFPVAIDEIKIKVNHISDIEFVDGEPVQQTIAPAVKVVETDEEAMNRIATRFEILDEMASACIRGDIRAMIVSGPPGVGKSFGVERQLEKAALFDQIAGNRPRFEVVKGAMTALGLYALLYKYSDKKNILVFDDCDSVFGDELTLNILKAALDSGKRRRICWNSDSRLLREEGIPNSFNFNGAAIFITNLKFQNVRSKKLQDHLEALESRCHFLDLTIDSDRDKMLRIRQVHRDADTAGGLFADYCFAANEGDQIFSFMEQNVTRLRELSIRMALKIADLVKLSPTKWQSLAENTVMKHS